MALQPIALQMELLEDVPETTDVPDTDVEDDAPWGWDLSETSITLDMLRRRNDIREALRLGLVEAFPDTFNEEDEIEDETIIEMMNMDPEVKTHLIEILLELTDCAEAEGEPGYYPSILEYSSVEDILEINKLTGFRESKECIPYKYEHLSTETIGLIYSNPSILPLISKMKKEHITNSLIRSVLAK